MTTDRGRWLEPKWIALIVALSAVTTAAVAFAVTGYGTGSPSADDIPRIVTNRAQESTAAVSTETPSPDTEPLSAEQDGGESGEREVVRPSVRDDDDDEDGESSSKKSKSE